MNPAQGAHLTVLYDGDCGFCKVSLAVVLNWDRHRHLYPVAIQSEQGQRLLASLEPAARLRSAHVVTAGGTVLSGGRGAPDLFRALPAGRPLAALAAAAMPLTVVGYGVLTKLRSVIGPMLPDTWRDRAELLITERRRGITPPTVSR